MLTDKDRKMFNTLFENAFRDLEMMEKQRNKPSEKDQVMNCLPALSQDKKISVVRNIMKWISVKDSLPPLSETVLVADEDGDIYLADRSRKGYPYNDEEWEWRENVDGWAIYNVTHWLPIPELPR